MSRTTTDPQSASPAAHVLVVDDTLRNIQVLGVMLRSRGYRINTASNGEEALESVRRVRPDIILMDVMMPAMDGFEATRRLKADPSTAAIPVIFLTSLDDSDHVVKGFEAGAVDYVTKPFQQAELESRLETHLTISRLQSRLEDRVQQLRRALEDIERLHREQNAMLRHELNNEVTPLIGYSELIQRTVGNSVDPKLASYLQQMVDGSRSLGGLLRSLRDLHSLERGDHPLRREACDVHEMITAILSDLSIQFGALVQFDLDVQLGGYVIPGDPFLIPGVFRNLIKNAAEHVENLKPAESVVTVRLSADNEEVRVTVHNGGPPVPDEALKTFFDRFNTTKRERGGTGLGTSYAFLVTRAHGGAIGVTSSQEEGTIVTLRLPRDPSLY